MYSQSARITAHSERIKPFSSCVHNKQAVSQSLHTTLSWAVWSVPGLQKCSIPTKEVMSFQTGQKWTEQCCTLGLPMFTTMSLLWMRASWCQLLATSTATSHCLGTAGFLSKGSTSVKKKYVWSRISHKKINETGVKHLKACLPSILYHHS